VTLPISITSIGSFSSLGNTNERVWESYLTGTTLIKNIPIGLNDVPAACIPAQLRDEVDQLRKSDLKYSILDDSVLYAIMASRSAVKTAGWDDKSTFGINIGSSRGATQLFEKHHAEYIATGKTAVHASPSSTLGNISSWVAHDLKSAGPEISHSITCSTALHALLNGVAWLRAGMAEKFLVGGSEAPLTAFTIAQMQAMKIYSSEGGALPCRALDMEKRKNSLVLGEGAASACLEAGRIPNALAYIEGIGYATEILKHSASISADAECLQRSMAMALKDVDIKNVDAVVMHAPGTIKGDTSEYTALQKIFGSSMPLLTTNKWMVGHTFGASGLLSLEMAILMMKHNKFIGLPYGEAAHKTGGTRNIRKVLINAVGFGGNAVSVLLTKK